MVRFSLTVSEETLDDLRLFAFKKGVSMNSIVVNLLTKWLEEERKKYPDVFAGEKIPKKQTFRSIPLYMANLSSKIFKNEEKQTNIKR